MKQLTEEFIVGCNEEAIAKGLTANNTFGRLLEQAHEIYRQGWKPVYWITDDESAIHVGRAGPDMRVMH